MVMVVVGVLGLVVLIGLFCVRNDAPLYYPMLTRLLFGVATASALATAVAYIIVAVIGCNDVDKYSFLWYAMGCWYDEHSR